MSEESLEGQVVAVIGGSSGIGLGVAMAAGRAGAKTIIGSRDMARLERARKRIGGEVEVLQVDVTDEDSTRAFFAQIPQLDHLLTSIHVPAMGAFRNMTSERARGAFDAKFWGQALAAQYAAPKMQPRGSITFISGAWGMRPQAEAAIPAAMNSAIEGLGRALAVELSPVRVNTISPGLVDTTDYQAQEKPSPRDSAFFAGVAQQLPAKYVGTPRDIARVAMFLMSTPYITGSTLAVDGGYTLR